MDKEILATINCFRSASLVFSSPENLVFWYLIAHAVVTCCDITHCHKV